MTERTINLYDGLEALYYFDSDYFDGGANELSDQSGYERHATASGGPTLGIEGPDSFEAASFDGSDDYFDSGTTISQNGEQFFFAQFKPTGTFGTIALTGLNSNGIELNFDGQGDLAVTLVDQSGDTHTAVSGNYSTDQWFNVVCGYDGSDLVIVANGEDVDRISVPSHEAGTNNFTVGRRPGGGAEFEGEIAAVGTWFRSLSDAEIEQLNRLTAPRRAQL